MLIGNIDRTVDQIADRIDELVAFDKLVEATWGDASLPTPRHRERYDKVFAEGDDPDDLWNGANELGNLLMNWEHTK